MRWDRDHESPDVVDARRQSAGLGGGGAGGAFMLLRLASRWGWKGILVGVFLLGILTFVSRPVGLVGSEAAGYSDEKEHFVAFVLDDVQAEWGRRLQGYSPAKLVLFSGSTPTACGYGSAASGPFYCPLDQRVYIDLSFYDELARRFGAPGDFAQAYVIAHEVGHHVQHLAGTDQRVPQGRGAQGADGASVRLELQADCYAGLWAKSAARRGILEMGDLEEGLRAAAAIGDDALQSQDGAVRPESFTHGTSAQRSRWLRIGYQTGTLGACDTFEVSQL